MGVRDYRWATWLSALLIGGPLALSGCAPNTPNTPSSPEADKDPPSASPTSAQTQRSTAWGPEQTDIQRARRDVGTLNLRELAGQVIVARYSGTRAPTRFVEKLHLGGVVAFDSNISSRSQISRANHRLQANTRRDWPVFVGIDQEGGVVRRIHQGPANLPAFMAAGAGRDAATTRAAMRSAGIDLRDLGFNVDLAPDADVTIGAADPTIGTRSAGSNAALVATQAVAGAKGLRAAGVLPVLKHFPGHGSATVDSHVRLPVVDRNMAQLRKRELAPFRRAIEAGLPAIMIGHLKVPAIDKGAPTSLSHQAITGLLRNDMGFQGLVISDALDMGAVRGKYGSGSAAVRSLRAGSDVVLMPPDPTAARDAIVAAVKAGDLTRTRLRTAATRQIAALRWLGRTPQQTVEHRSVQATYARQAITVVNGACRGPYINGAIKVSGAAGDELRAAARRAGVPLGRGTRVAVLDNQSRPARADVVVAVDRPYILARSRARTKIAAFGDTPASMDALIAVLRGRAAASGRLPVAVTGAEDCG